MSTSSNKLSHEDVEYLKNVLRKATTKWKGRARCLQRARKKVLIRRSKKGKPVYKFHWKCAVCEKWYRDIATMEVDHIVEIGSFTGDWNDFINRMYDCDDNNLQALCIVCHQKKTLRFNSARTRWKRK